jgi:hypothetical protein
MLDALMALALWSALGLGLMLQTRWAMVQQRANWSQSMALEWQIDLLERLHLSSPGTPISVDWGQKWGAGSADCTSAECPAVAWRDSLLAEWQSRLGQELAQAQVWLAPWDKDARVQAMGVRWPERSAGMASVTLNQQSCPEGWRCMFALGWP